MKLVAVLACLGAFVGVVTVLGIGLFWLLPTQVIGDTETAYIEFGDSAAWGLLVLMLAWIAMVGGVTWILIRRLRRPAGWRMDGPWSVWRTVKYVLLIVGWAGLLALYPWAVIDNLLPEPDLAPRPAAPAALIGCCLLALLLGVAISTLDSILAKARSGSSTSPEPKAGSMRGVS